MAFVRDVDKLTAWLHGELPLTKAMGVEVAAWDGKNITVVAPLEPNLNHTETAFGGSISSLGILAGWALLSLLLKEQGVSCRVLIQKSSTDFLRPIDTEITATASLSEKEAEELVESMKKKRRGKLTLDSQVLSRKTVAAKHVGTYVMICI
ncbi:MAG: thioesterase domain-containing protein [Phycisphaerales bacterium]|nr:thioesterase domain-containing protein [Phycisphaerales bacterium]